MDYRRDLEFYSLTNNHKDGNANASGSLMRNLWENYYKTIGASSTNYAARGPVSYYDNANRLSTPLCYVNNSNYSVEIILVNGKIQKEYMQTVYS